MPDGDKPYQEYLDQFPEALRPQVEPIFDKWDADVNKRFEGIHEEYEPYKPIIDAGIQPDYLSAGVDLLNQVNNDPSKVFTALANHLQQQGIDISQLVQGFGGTSTPPNNNPSSVEDEYPDLPDSFKQKIQNLERLSETNARAVIKMEEERQRFDQERQQQEGMTDLLNTLDRVAPEDKYNRQFLLSYIAAGQTPEQAVQSYNQWFQTQGFSTSSVPTPPRVAPGSGGVPSSQIDVARLGSQDTKSMVTEYLRRANES